MSEQHTLVLSKFEVEALHRVVGDYLMDCSVNTRVVHAMESVQRKLSNMRDLISEGIRSEHN